MSESSMVSKEAILAQQDLVIETVALPKPYSGHVYVKTMTGDDWDDYQDSVLIEDEKGARKVDLKQSKAKLIVRCVCDETGELVFSAADIPALMKKSNKLLEALAKVAQRLNGMSEESPEKN